MNYLQDKFFILSSIFITSFIFIGTIFAEVETPNTGDLFFEPQSFRTDPISPVVNNNTRIYIRIQNTGDADMKGVVRAYDMSESKKIDIEQTFSTIESGDADVFWDFTPSSHGVHEIAFRIIPWENYPENNLENDKVVYKIFVDKDLDNDGIGDQVDDDIDGDGVVNNNDAFPENGNETNDSDNDGIGDNGDQDDDNDGIVDTEDSFPNNPSEGSDTDSDGVGNNEDEDDDNDGIKDEVEFRNGTDPNRKDTDGDGVDDGADDYPRDQKYQQDTDKDGEPNKEDNDDDNDGVDDGEDAFPLNKKEWKDSDNDGIGDLEDSDDDNDGLSDEEEAKKGTSHYNTDHDGDGVLDGEDGLPIDASETKDTDGDGRGDNLDEFDDNKGPVILLDKAGPFTIYREEELYINASGSTDPEGGNLDFNWEVLDMSGNVLRAKTGSDFTLKSTKTGDFIIRLVVTDEVGEKREMKLALTVSISSGEIYKWIGGIGGIGLLFLLFWFFWKRRKKDEKNGN